MKIELIILMGAALMGSCKNSPEGSLKQAAEASIKEMPVNDTCRTIKVPDMSLETMINVETIFDSVSFVRLSNKPEAILGGVNQLIINDSLLIIRDCYSTKSVKIFSLSGDYLRRIGNYGRGPGEYMQPTYMQLTPDGNILIWDQFLRKLSCYDLAGKFLYAANVPFFCLKFYRFGNSRYMFNSVNSDNDKFKAIINYSLFECNDRMEPVYRGLYRKKGTYESFLTDHNFFDRDSILYYHPIYCDTIYSVRPDRTIKAEFAFDFGRQTVPERLRKGKRRKEVRREQSLEKYSFMSGDFYLTDHYLHFGYTRAHRQFNGIYSFDTGELVTFFRREGFFPIPFLNIVCSTDNAFVGYFFPALVLQHIQGWDKADYDKLVKQFGQKMVDLGLSLQNEDNPVITFFYLK